MKIKLSKSQWETIGEKAGWIKKSMRDYREAFIDMDTFDLIESKSDLHIDDRNTWEVSYNNSTFEDDILTTELYSRYGNTFEFLKQLLAAAGASAVNVVTGEKIGSERLAEMAHIDQPAFWEAIRKNNEVYRIERENEKIDIAERDDQDVGEYVRSGPDLQKPQY